MLEDELTFHHDEFIVSIIVYFAHFISGIQIETNRTTKLFGVGVEKNTNPNNATQILAAPQGAAIMGFYGSFSRLFETIGCYCVTLDSSKYRKSLLRKNKARGSKHAQQNSGQANTLQVNTSQEAEPDVTATQETQNEDDIEEEQPQSSFFQKLGISSK